MLFSSRLKSTCSTIVFTNSHSLLFASQIYLFNYCFHELTLSSLRVSNLPVQLLFSRTHTLFSSRLKSTCSTIVFTNSLLFASQIYLFNYCFHQLTSLRVSNLPVQLLFSRTHTHYALLFASQIYLFNYCFHQLTSLRVSNLPVQLLFSRTHTHYALLFASQIYLFNYCFHQLTSLRVSNLPVQLLFSRTHTHYALLFASQIYLFNYCFHELTLIMLFSSRLKSTCSTIVFTNSHSLCSSLRVSNLPVQLLFSRTHTHIVAKQSSSLRVSNLPVQLLFSRTHTHIVAKQRPSKSPLLTRFPDVTFKLSTFRCHLNDHGKTQSSLGAITSKSIIGRFS